MTPERARELLGGLATGILTPEERQTLFEAALHDQTLFNEVADELEFAAFLQSPETRAQLVNRIPQVEPARRPWWALRPAWLALSGALAASAVLFVAVWNHPNALRPAPVEVSAPASPPPPPAAALESMKTEAVAAKPKPATNAPGKQAPDNQVASNQAVSKQPSSKEKVAIADKAAEPVAAAPLASANPPSPPPAPKDFAPQAARGAASPMLPRTTTAQETVRKDERAGPAQTAPAVAPPEARNRIAMAAPSPPPAAMVAGTPPPSTASLEGTVRDASGAPVARAAVDVVNAAGATTHTTSDASGKFAVQSLPPGGPYTVTAQAPGFRREQKSGITLSANQPARVDLPLQLGEVSQTVEVAASAGLIKNFKPVQQVAVLDFVNSPGQGQAGQQAADQLSRQLLDGGQVRVIDRGTVQQAWQSQTQQSQSQQSQSQSGKTRPPNAKQVAAFARTIGADAVIVGTVQGSEPEGVFSAVDRQNPKVAVTAEVIDTKKARSTAKVAVTAASLKGATSQLGIAIQSKLSPPLQGTVSRVEGETITVAVALPGQPRIGERLGVYRGNRKIGELILTTAYGQSAVGKFAGAGQPRNGDRVASLR